MINLAQTLGSEPLDVDGMSDEELMELLLKRKGGGVPPGLSGFLLSKKMAEREEADLLSQAMMLRALHGRRMHGPRPDGEQQNLGDFLSSQSQGNNGTGSR
jgi:hypothetical protein